MRLMLQIRQYEYEDLAMRAALLILAVTVFFNAATAPLISPEAISIFAWLGDRIAAIVVAIVWAGGLVSVAVCYSPAWRRVGGQLAFALCISNALVAFVENGVVSPFVRLGVMWLLAALVVIEVASHPVHGRRTTSP